MSGDYNRPSKSHMDMEGRNVPCPVCKFGFKNLLTHLRQAENCRKGFSAEELDEMRKSGQASKRDHRQKVMDSQESDETRQCPSCKMTFKNVLMHIKRSEMCRSKFSTEYLDEMRRSGKVRIRDHRQKLMEGQDPDETRQCPSCKMIFKNVLMHIQRSDECQSNVNPDELEKMMKTRGMVNKDYYEKKKGKMDAADRIRKFWSSMEDGLTFKCASCARLLFQSQVTKISAEHEEVVKQVLQIEKLPGQYWCGTCRRHIKNGEIPPMCVQNGLQIEEVPEFLQSLNELEATLVSRRIIFIKIHNLPTSRWTGFHDKV
jgi:hypothetical protein